MTREHASALGIVLLVVSAALCPRIAVAHEVIPPPTAEIMFSPDSDTLVVDARLPIAGLADANLPRTPDGPIDRRSVGPALDLVARVFATGLDITDDGQPLRPPAVRVALSEAGNDVIIQLTYRRESANGRLAARIVTYRAGPLPLTTTAHYDTASGRRRSFAVTGDPLRVDFEPRAAAVVRHMAGAAIEWLLASADYVLFALCVTVPLAARRPWLATIGWLLVGEAVSAVTLGTGAIAVSPQSSIASQALAASAIVIAALLDITGSSSRWLKPLALVFGLAHGLNGGESFLGDVSFAGSRVALGLLTFLSTAMLGQLWTGLLLGTAMDLVVRQGAGAWLLNLGLSILAAHSGLHRMTDRSQQLAASGSWVLDRWLVVLALGWALVILCAGLLEATIFAANKGASRRMAGAEGAAP